MTTNRPNSPSATSRTKGSRRDRPAPPRSDAAACDSATRRDHHGRQSPLGQGARPAGDRRPSPRHRRAASRHPCRERRSASRSLTVYGFSTENWNRNANEISLLIELCVYFARNELAELRRNNVRVRVIGDWEALPVAPREALAEMQASTAANTGLILNLAINYSSRCELERAVRRIAIDVAAGNLARRSNRRRVDRALSVHGGSSGARLADSPGRRASALQLPALPGGVRRTGHDRRLVARFREGPTRCRAR